MQIGTPANAFVVNLVASDIMDAAPYILMVLTWRFLSADNKDKAMRQFNEAYMKLLKIAHSWKKHPIPVVYFYLDTPGTVYLFKQDVSTNKVSLMWNERQYVFHWDPC
jgi:hypothetical protein